MKTDKCGNVLDGVMVSFPSHRAREYAMRCLGQEPQGYSSLRRGTTGGYYLLTEAQVEQLRASDCQHIRFAVLKAPYTDLLECISHEN